MVEFFPVKETDLAAILAICHHYILNSTATFHREKMSEQDIAEFLCISHPKFRVMVGTICGDNRAGIRLMENAGFSKCAHLKNIGEKFGRVLDVVIYQKEI
jgi:L-amino acid N-acyltransferase YncA